MPFPVSLSLSPVSEAFSGIQFDPLEKLALSDAEKSLIRAAEENPLDYTLNDHNDVASYARLLLKVIDITSSSGDNKNLKVSKLSLDQCLSDDEALHLLYVDPNGVWLHYAISKLSEVIVTLRSGKNTKTAIATTFFPSGFLLEDWRILHRILSESKSDPYAQRGAAYCLACILLEGCLLEQKCQLFSSLSSALRTFVSWATSRLQSATSPSSLAIVTPSTTIILENSEARLIFNEYGGPGYLSRHLHFRDKDSNEFQRTAAGASFQQLYELTYCLWLLSFDCSDHHSLRKHFYRDGAVPALVDLIAAATREKVTRLALSTLRNLATFVVSRTSEEGGFDALAFRTEMIGCGLLKCLDRVIEAAKWNDQDTIDDINVLKGHLQETFSHMTRWDVYLAEVESSHLQWGILHSEKFLRENVKRFEGDDGQFRIIHDLVRLTASLDEEVAAIACFDLGEFVRHYPNGRLIASRMGARDAVMALIDHSHEELQKQALLAVSKMLIQNWQAVG